jgi:hypothetical protein
MSEQKQKKLLAKAFHSEYIIGEHVLKGWEAKIIGDKRYQITRSNGATLEVGIGDIVPKAGEVSVDINKNLKIGKYTVLTGEDIISGWEARPSKGKGNYRVRTDDGTYLNVKAGERHESLGLIEMNDDYGNLVINGRSVPVTVWKMEYNLLVLNAREKSGYKAYFNLLETGNSDNLKNGIPGVFYPASGNRPAKFCELGTDGVLYSTAVFFPSADKKFSNGKMRAIDLAEEEKALVRDMKDKSELVSKIVKECEELAVDIEDHPDHEPFMRTREEIETMQERLTHLNKRAWIEKSFSVTNGKEVFGLVASNKPSAGRYNKSDKNDSPTPA